MKISLKDIRACSECPAYLAYLKQSLQKPINEQLFIASQVIKRAYTIASETGFKASWRRLLAQVDTMVFKNVEYSDTEQFQTAKRIAEHILLFLQRWYHEIYLEEDTIGYIDLDIERPLGRHIIYGTAPIVTLHQCPVITYINDVESNEAQMYNNLEVRGLLWLLSESLDCDTVLARYITMGPQGGFSTSGITTDKESNKRTKSTILQVAYLIQNKMSFPSVTEKCEKCAFKRRCRI